ncbi:MAG TPA: succinylglutamate desuccinylase/aspartoacylase family protein [Blastocatellia bacterium]|nr:succinylglutamate desuccinylase/aspartoacylase family protein [Blastocatellia bacterium]
MSHSISSNLTVAPAIIHPTGQDIELQRILGSYGGDVPGPLVIGLGGLHGNEPAGVRALQQVVQTLQATAPPLRGKFLALAGNLTALQRGTRFVERDLNRMWSPERVRALNAQTLPTPETVEETEQKELLAVIEAALNTNPKDVIFLDLHTTSSDGAPFALISDTLTNRKLAQALGTPLILGLEESLDGTILNYVNELGHAAIGFEAGQHKAPQTIANHVAAVWITLVEAGCLNPEDVPELAAHRQRLQQASQTLPPVFEVRYRHAITVDDAFVMRPGFANFTRVTKQQNVAADRHGAVRVPETGFLFMPLYQSLGEDGFFVVREVKPFWLRVSEWLRNNGADEWLHLLPGVHYLAGDKNSLIINTKIARWFVLEICHLLGFRKYSRINNQLVISRRKQAYG